MKTEIEFVIYDTEGRDIAWATSLPGARVAVRTLLHEQQDEAFAIYHDDTLLETLWLDESGGVVASTGDHVRQFERGEVAA